VLTLLNSYLSHAVVKCWATRGWQRGGGGRCQVCCCWICGIFGCTLGGAQALFKTACSAYSR
jgi:hypothetical protein